MAKAMSCRKHSFNSVLCTEKDNNSDYKLIVKQMAQRRMTSLDVIDTDAFLDMPQSSQLLYFHLNARADDDGFVSSPKRIARSIGSQDDDLKLLSAKKFIIPFTDGVCVIKHWRVNNFIRKDIYKETQYLNLKQSLFIRSNGSYTTTDNDRSVEIPKGHFTLESVDVTLTSRQPRLGKVREGKVSIVKDKKSDKSRVKNFNVLGAEVIKAFEEVDAKNKTYYANKTQRACADFLVDEYGLDKVLKVIKLIPQTNGKDFYPNITSPYDLKEKWMKLASALQKTKNNQTVIL